MAGGAIYPSSVDYGPSGNIYQNLYVGAGGNAAPNDWGHGVAASLGVDATLSLRFPMPPVIPAGTLKLRNLMLVSAPAGNTIKYTVNDANVAAGASPSAASLTAETQTSHTFNSGATDTDKYIEVKTTLTASPAGNDQLVVAVVFNHTSWTLAVVLTNIFSIIWE